MSNNYSVRNTTTNTGMWSNNPLTLGPFIHSRIDGSLVVDEKSSKLFIEHSKLFFKLNTMSEEEQMKEILVNPDNFKYIIDPTESVKNAYQFKEEL